MQRLSKGFFLSSPIVGIASLSILGIALAISGPSLSNSDPGVVLLLVLALFGGIYTSIVALVFIYKIWDAIADEHARTTPGKAVGFLFIPSFDFYSSFQLLCGVAKNRNASTEPHSTNAKKLPEGLFPAC